MNRTAIVTGATSGIGKAAALRLAGLGYDVVITGRRKDRLAEVEKEIAAKGVKAYVLAFDIRDKAQVDRAVDSLPETVRKHIAVLVNNAGLAAGLEPIQEGDTDDWERMIDTNVKGVLYMTRKVAPLMVANRKGHIVNLGSIAGVEVYANGNVYCATKHAVHALSQAMRIDLLPYGIKVSEIRPGMVETEFSLVRFHGDRQKADNVYRGVEPLTGDDIAATIEYLVTLPPHVNINDVEIMPLAQADAFYTHRES